MISVGVPISLPLISVSTCLSSSVKSLIWRFYVFSESFRPTIFHNSGPDKHAWNIGKTANWREVFGDVRARWFLPVYTA